MYNEKSNYNQAVIYKKTSTKSTVNVMITNQWVCKHMADTRAVSSIGWG